MDSSRGDSRYNLNYSMSSIGLSLADQPDMYGNPAAVAALGGRPPSGGLTQTMSGGPAVGFGARSSAGLIPSVTQCQSLVTAANTNHAGNTGGGHQRGVKRAGSDCYEDHHRGGLAVQSLQGLESCGGGGPGNNQQIDQQQQQQQQQQSQQQQQQQQQHQQQQQQQQQTGVNVADVSEDGYNTMQSKKSPPANGKKTKGRVKIKMEYIDNKLRRYTTFSKRKTGIMKKAYELSTLTGTQVMLLVASETGHVYTFATRKLQPMITSEAGKQLIQTCLNSPDPPSVGGGDQRMSATGFEETELSYNIADEDSKDFRLHMSSGNESDDSSDVDSPVPPALTTNKNTLDVSSTVAVADDTGHVNTERNVRLSTASKVALDEPMQYELKMPSSSAMEVSYSNACNSLPPPKREIQAAKAGNSSNNLVYPSSSLANIPKEVLLQLIQSGQLQLHNEEDGSGHQYVAIPLSSDTANLLKACNLKNINSATTASAASVSAVAAATKKEQAGDQTKVPNAGTSASSEMIIKQEVE